MISHVAIPLYSGSPDVVKAGINLDRVSEYQRDQWHSFKAIEKACGRLLPGELEILKNALLPYLQFRTVLDDFYEQFFGSYCRTTCYENNLSACCGFESIFTFFADQVITFLLSTPEDFEALLANLEQPNQSERCVYLTESGCVCRVRPISCAMFFCEPAKQNAFGANPDVAAFWEELKKTEKVYTYPAQPVLFDDLERVFIARGVDSPHMYFHKSPGLLRVKARSGLEERQDRLPFGRDWSLAKAPM
jgi:hypothetical protein